MHKLLACCGFALCALFSPVDMARAGLTPLNNAVLSDSARQVWKEHFEGNTRIVVNVVGSLSAQDAVFAQPAPGLLEVLPVDGRISSSFGPRKLRGERVSRHHSGVDIAAAQGTAVAATAGGRVIFSGTAGNYGKTVKIDHGNGMVTLYAHLGNTAVRHGQRVRAGQLLGTVGRTGRATGPNLHFEVIKDGTPIDPLHADLWRTAVAFR